jgi:hypothetical protein
MMVARRLSTTERVAKKAIFTGWSILGRCRKGRVLPFYEELELVCGLRRFILHSIVIDVELRRLSTVFPTKLELELLPRIVLTDFIFLRIKEIKVR